MVNISFVVVADQVRSGVEKELLEELMRRAPASGLYWMVEPMSFYLNEFEPQVKIEQDIKHSEAPIHSEQEVLFAELDYYNLKKKPCIE